MSSKELLLRHVKENLVSYNRAFEEFAQVVTQYYRSRHESEPDEATIGDWYTRFRIQDEVTLQVAEQRIETFLNENRESQLLELERSQLIEYFSLEDVVRKLDNVNQLLDKRLSYVDESIRNNTIELQKFNELLESANSSKMSNGKDTN